MLVSPIAIALSLAQETPTFEILAEKEKVAVLRVWQVSPSGAKIFCGIKDDLIGGGSGQGAIVSGGNVEYPSVPQDSPYLNCVAINDEGSLLMISTYIKRSSARSYIYRDQTINWIIDDANPFHSLVAFAFSRDGDVLARDVPNFYDGAERDLGEDLVRVKGDSLLEVFHGFRSFPSPASYNSLLASTPRGYVGTIYVESSHRHGFGGETWRGGNRPCYISRGYPEFLETQADEPFGTVSSATSDGEVVAGATLKGLTVWKDGRQIDMQSSTYSRMKESMRSLDKNGTMGVGIVYPHDHGFVWFEKEGAISFDQFLERKKVTIPEGWQVVGANYISEDGLTIVGSVQKKSHIRPFRLHLPKEPVKKQG